MSSAIGQGFKNPCMIKNISQFLNTGEKTKLIESNIPAETVYQLDEQRAQPNMHFSESDWRHPENMRKWKEYSEKLQKELEEKFGKPNQPSTLKPQKAETDAEGQLSEVD